MAGPSPDRTPNTSRRVCKLKSRGSPKSPAFLRPFLHADAIVEQPEKIKSNKIQFHEFFLTKFHFLQFQKWPKINF